MSLTQRGGGQSHFNFGFGVEIGNNRPMTTTAPAHSEFSANPVKVNRPNMVAVGTIVWLSSELMFFAALFAMYFTTRAVQGPKAVSYTHLTLPTIYSV